MTGKIYLDGEYAKRNPSWHAEDSPWKADQILKVIEDNHLKPSSVCEVGCGAGEILNQLYHRMPDHVVFYGYEISPDAFALCKERERDRLHFKLEDPLADATAHTDLVLTIDVIEHIDDCFGFLRRLRAKGTYHILHIPLDMSAQSVARGRPLLWARQQVGHIHYFTKDTALATLRETGYELLDAFYTASGIDLPGKTLLSRLARTPRRLCFRLRQDLTARVLGGFSLMVLAR